MSYLVFARKYRPQTFSEILGQEAIVKTLTNAIRQERIGQAYLFSGPRGTGKTSTARIFAKGLNCEKGPTATPCLKCHRCEEIASGSSLDVLEIDGASNRGIDQIRALRELAKFIPTSGQYKVYIIDEVHQITAEGFNALLKTLEEPPAHVLFILATTASHKVPATILSRCQRYDFRRLPLKLIAEKIQSVAKVEKIRISPEAVMRIAKAASGSLRDAESILDQVTAFTGGKVEEQDIRALLGDLDEELFVRAMEGIRDREPVKLLSLVAEASDTGTDLVQWGLSFLSFLRNLLVAKVGSGSLGFDDLGAESIDRLKKLAESFSVEALTAVIQEVTAALELMRRVGEPRIPLEVALVRLGTGGSLVEVSDLLDRLEALGERLQSGTRPPPRPDPDTDRGGDTPAAPARPVPGRAALDPRDGPGGHETGALKAPPRASESQAAGLQALLSAWPAFLDEMHRRKASAAGYLAAARPIGLEEGDPRLVVIGFLKGFEFHRQALDHVETRRVIAERLGELLGFPVQCRFQVVESFPEEASGGATAQAAERQPEEAADPSAEPNRSALHSVLELFEGRILPGEQVP